MSEEKTVLEKETEETAAAEDTAAENNEEKTDQGGKKEKKKFFTPNKIEIITAVFLGITALLTAWATWIGSLHGGNQSTNYTKSNNLAAEGNAEYNAGMQLYLSDLMAWNTVMDYSFDAQIADLNGKTQEAQVIRSKIETYIPQNCSKIIIDASGKMTEGMTSPFEVEGVTEQYFTSANELIAQSQELLEEGQRDNAHGDASNLVNVIYSVVLFLLGIVGVFKSLPNRAAVMIIAIIGVILASIYMFTIPLPTGFNFLSFFGAG